MLTPQQAGQERGRLGAAPPVIGRPGVRPSLRVRALDAEAFLVAAVIVASTLVALLWATVHPYSGGTDPPPDETAQFGVARFIAEHDRFPVFDKEPDFPRTFCYSEAGPCYTTYATRPGSSSVISAAFMKLQHAVTGTPYTNMYIAARLTSVLSIPIYVFFLWMTIQLLLSERLVRITALMLGSFIPQVTFIGSFVTDHAFSLAAGAAVTYLSLRLLRDGFRGRMGIYCGVALGFLAQGTGIYYPIFGLFGAAWAISAFRAWREERTLRSVVSFSLVTAVLATAIGSWWLVRNFLLYGDPLGLEPLRQAFNALAPLRQTPAEQGVTFTSLLDDPLWRRMSFRSFWATFGWVSIMVNHRIYLLIEAMLVAAAAGLVIALHQALSDYGRKVWQWWRSWAWLLLALLVPSAILFSAWTSVYNDYQPQGRYLYSALIPVVLLTSHGLHSLWENGVYRQTVTLFVGGGMILLNLYSLIFVLVPIYYK